jgi:palmitoyltransferase ZDHHC9/14/18
VIPCKVDKALLDAKCALESQTFARNKGKPKACKLANSRAWCLSMIGPDDHLHLRRPVALHHLSTSRPNACQVPAACCIDASTGLPYPSPSNTRRLGQCCSERHASAKPPSSPRAPRPQHRRTVPPGASSIMAARDASPTSTSSMLSNITVQIEKQADVRALSSASPSSSTPPTSLDDEASVLSEVAKNDAAGGVLLLAAALPVSEVDAHGTPHAPSTMPPTEGRRSARSSRKSVATYNVQILAGTAIHTPTKYLEKHHKNVVHGSLEALAKKENLASAKKKGCRPRTAPTAIDDLVEEQLAAEAAQATRRRTSSRMTDLRKEAFRNLSGVGELATSTLSRGLRRSASDSHLKLTATQSSSSSKHPHTKIEDESGTEIDEPYLKPKTKVWLRQGLYVGQHRDFKSRLSESQNRARKRSKKPRDDDVLPFPMFAADRLLNEDPHHVFRDFKLPFDTYNPLPRKVKVDGWVKLHKSKHKFLEE